MTNKLQAVWVGSDTVQMLGRVVLALLTGNGEFTCRRARSSHVTVRHLFLSAAFGETSLNKKAV